MKLETLLEKASESKDKVILDLHDEVKVLSEKIGGQFSFSLNLQKEAELLKNDIQNGIIKSDREILDHKSFSLKEILEDVKSYLTGYITGEGLEEIFITEQYGGNNKH